MDVRHYGSFSDLIRAIRRENQLSQRAMAKALRVSPGYVGQWELKLSQPSAEVTVKLCRTFSIGDIEYVQRLAFASRAPEWLRESILRYEQGPRAARLPSAVEQRILSAVRKLSPERAERLAEKIDGWVEAQVDG